MKPILVLDLTKLDGYDVAQLWHDGFDVPQRVLDVMLPPRGLNPTVHPNIYRADGASGSGSYPARCTCRKCLPDARFHEEEEAKLRALYSLRMQTGSPILKTLYNPNNLRPAGWLRDSV